MTGSTDSQYVTSIEGTTLEYIEEEYEYNYDENIYHIDDEIGQIDAEYLMVAGLSESWENGETNTLHLSITPQTGGPFPINIRSALHSGTWNSNYDVWINTPAECPESETDQQGWCVEVQNVDIIDNELNDLIWSTIQDGYISYEIHIMSNDFIPNLESRPLSEDIDAANIQHIYCTANDDIIPIDATANLVYKTQSVKKYVSGNPINIEAYTSSTIEYYDIEEVTRTDSQENEYTVFVPDATNGWWQDMFVFGGNDGFDVYTSRVDRYHEVFLSLILQQDIADELTDQTNLLDQFYSLYGYLSSGSEIADILNAIAEANPSNLISSQQLHQFFNHLETHVHNFHEHKYFQKMSNVFSTVGFGIEVSADVARFITLQALADANSDARLYALNRWIEGTALDPALEDGFAEAMAEYQQIIDQEWYDQLGIILQQNIISVDYFFSLLLSAFPMNTAAGLVILPYYLSWQVYGQILEQSHNAQYATLAATIWQDIFSSTNSYYDSFSQSLSSSQVELSDVNDLVYLTNLSTYLGWYYYRKYLDICNNSINGWFYNLLDYINLGNWEYYSDFITHLEGKREENLSYFSVTAPDFFLTRNHQPFDLDASDSENSFLLSKIRDYQPDIIPPGDPIVANFVVTNGLTGEAPYTISISNESTGDIDNYIWTFGDGSSSNSQNPSSHTYEIGSSYPLTLQVSNDSETNSLSQYVLVTEPIIVAGFSADQTSITVGDMVGFSNESSGNNLSYFWSFGDGESSSDDFPSHQYNFAGIFNVSLTAYGAGGQDQEVKSSYIHVEGEAGIIHVESNNQLASFLITGPVVISGNGVDVEYSDVPVGEYTCTFSSIIGYDTPVMQTYILENNSEINFSGNYIGITCSDEAACNFNGSGECIFPEDFWPDTDEDGFGAGEPFEYCPDEIPTGWVNNNDDNCPDGYDLTNECISGCTDPDALNYCTECSIDNDSCSYEGDCVDFDGNVYSTVTLGGQVWMTENLKVRHYRNGDAIDTWLSDPEWETHLSGAYAINVYSEANTDSSFLYNGYAVFDPRNIAPPGWHVPTDDDIQQLELYLGMSESDVESTGMRGTSEGGMLKEGGIGHWNEENCGSPVCPDGMEGCNCSGFTALPDGYRSDNGGSFSFQGMYFWMWSSSESSSTHAWLRKLEYLESKISRYADNKHLGLTIRCVKDVPVTIIGCTDLAALNYNPEATEDSSNCVYVHDTYDYEEFTYRSVMIGDQEWMVDNLRVTQYRDGSPIPNVIDFSEWHGLSTGAWSEYNNEPNLGNIYGKLYNWYAVDDDHNIAPVGWHVPTDEEWMELEMRLGMSLEEAQGEGYRGTNEGGKLKIAVDNYWDIPNVAATNESGFSGLPGGGRSNLDGQYINLGFSGSFWSITNYDSDEAWARHLFYDRSEVYRGHNYKRDGFSIRCIKNTTIVAGCTEPAACNYNDMATLDDGSCSYPQGCNDWCEGDLDEPWEYDCNNDCGGTAILDNCSECVEGGTGQEFNWALDCAADCFGTAIENECGCVEGNTGLTSDWCYGCTDPDAINFDPQILISDGSCVYIPALEAHGGDGEITISWDEPVLLMRVSHNSKLDNFIKINPQSKTLQSPQSEHETIRLLNRTEETYRLYRDENLLADGLTSNSYVDSGLDFNETHCYYVTVYLENSESNPSNTDCASSFDCSGIEGGGAFLDNCNVCSGGTTGLVPNADDLGCGCFNPAVITYCFDEDGDGLGAGVSQEYCLQDLPANWVEDCSDEDDQCQSNQHDCSGVCDGTSVIDDCGFCVSPENLNWAMDDCDVCFGNNQDMDCAGVCFGGSYEDECGSCDDNPINDCIQDCTGEWGGEAFINDCGCVEGDTGLLWNWCYGCTDPDANNYDLNASIDNGSCTYPGDINGDGLVDVSDIVISVGIILGSYSPSDTELFAADVNSDGIVNVVDIVQLVCVILECDLSKGMSVGQATVMTRNNTLILQTDGSPAGLQLTVSGDFEIAQNQLPVGWKLYSNQNTILMFSIDESSLDSETLFMYTGNLVIESALVTDWFGNGVNADIKTVPNSFSLGQAYPNPFNPVTTFEYSIPEDGIVSIAVYDITGRQVSQLIAENTYVSAGRYSVEFNTGNLPSGLYFVAMMAKSGSEEFTAKQKVVLLK